MEVIITIMVVIAYKLGYSHGFRECEDVVQDTLNRLMEDVKTMEAYKTGRVGWAKQENTCHTEDGQRKKKKN